MQSGHCQLSRPRSMDGNRKLPILGNILLLLLYDNGDEHYTMGLEHSANFSTFTFRWWVHQESCLRQSLQFKLEEIPCLGTPVISLYPSMIQDIKSFDSKQLILTVAQIVPLLSPCPPAPPYAI